MQAIILCGGLATRLGETTKTVPKILLDIAGQTVLAWQIKMLKDVNVEEVILASGHLHDVLYCVKSTWLVLFAFHIKLVLAHSIFFTRGKFTVTTHASEPAKARNYIPLFYRAIINRIEEQFKRSVRLPPVLRLEPEKHNSSIAQDYF